MARDFDPDVELRNDVKAGAHVIPDVLSRNLIVRGSSSCLLYHDVPWSRVVENGGSPLGKVGMPFRPCIPKSEHEYAGKEKKSVLDYL